MFIDTNKFHVVTMISNPMRFTRRYDLYDKFKKYMHECGINIWTCEVQTGDRPFYCTHATNPRDLQLRSEHILWHKENALNLMVQRLPWDWEYVAFIDADIEFLNRDWIQETVHQLQIYQIVQMWQNAIDLGPNGETLQTFSSFMSQYINKGCQFPEWYGSDYISRECHPGFAWAMNRSAFDAIGGLLDRAILGAGDRHMALAFVNKADCSYHPEAPEAYKKYILDYQDRIKNNLKTDVGYVPGTIIHHWHGKKKDRRYWDRWKILNDNQYDPFLDLRTDWQGLLALDDYSKPMLRDQVRLYFGQRNEDSIDN